MFAFGPRRKGYLVLIGGSEDRRGERHVLRRTLSVNSARTVTVIPAASARGGDLGREYEDAFREAGASKVHVLEVDDPSRTDRQVNVERIQEADLVFFTGGDQVKLVDAVRGTRCLELIRTKLLEGMTVAGTSAGAMACSETMIYYGDDAGLRKGAVRHSEGFGFLKKVTVDTHFLERRRIFRLAQFLAEGDVHYGVGISEDTGIALGPDSRFEVFGQGLVTVLRSDRGTFSNSQKVHRDDLVTVDGIRVGFLPPGSAFSIRRWAVDRRR